MKVVITVMVTPNKPARVNGTTQHVVELDKLFLTAFGVFGPFRFRVPRTKAVLVFEYGNDVLTTRKCKTINAAGHAARECVLVPVDCRRVAWPCVPIERCTDYLS